MCVYVFVGANKNSTPPIYFKNVAKNIKYSNFLCLTNPHWARVVGYGPFSLCIHKEGCVPAVGALIG
jgi:hypothetical protein